MTTASYNKGVELAEVCKQQLAEVGVNVTIETVDSATFNAALNGITPEEMPWDMFIICLLYTSSSLYSAVCLRRSGKAGLCTQHAHAGAARFLRSGTELIGFF